MICIIEAQGHKDTSVIKGDPIIKALSSTFNSHRDPLYYGPCLRFTHGSLPLVLLLHSKLRNIWPGSILMKEQHYNIHFHPLVKYILIDLVGGYRTGSTAHVITPSKNLDFVFVTLKHVLVVLVVVKAMCPCEEHFISLSLWHNKVCGPTKHKCVRPLDRLGNCPIGLALANYDDCRFKFQNQSRYKKVVNLS